MGYPVIYPFKDGGADGYRYAVGDSYPHDGRVVSNERLIKLSTLNNEYGKRFIVVDELPKEIDYDELTKKDIRKKLDGKGVEYNKRDTKKELFDLLGSD